MKNIILNKEENRLTVYVIEDGELAEMYTYTPEVQSSLGNIYIGKVVDIVNGMQAAFIDIGTEKNAFISVKDAMKKVDVAKEDLDSDVKMSDVLKVGDYILAQVKKEPIDEKGARVSTHITFPGKYIILMPDTEIITVSQKIEDENEKERLKKIAISHLPDNFGAIIRTDSCGMSEENIVDDINDLLEKWKTLSNNHSKTSQIKLIYNDHNIIERTIRDIVDQKTEKIYVNDDEIYSRIISYVEEKMCVLDKSENLISKFNLEREIEKISNRKTYLKCGGHIVIDKTEALTAIDVNSGKYTGSKDLESTTLKVNLEAAVEIMKQIRLKDIGGIIVIDFIDMHIQEHKDMVLETMRNEAKKDRSKVDIKDFTKLNLVELTRKKMYV